MANDGRCREKTLVKISSALEPKSPKPLKIDPDPEANYENSKVSSLSVIALEYDNCNSDVEEEVEVDSNKTENQNTTPVFEAQKILLEYRTIEESVSSSSEESDSEDDSSSSYCTSIIRNSNNSSSSDSDNDSDDTTGIPNDKKKIENKAGIARRKKQIENDEFDDLPPIEDLKISLSEDKCELLGEIEKIVKKLVIVKPKPGKPTLHIDTVLFIEKEERRKALGQIFDVFGPVSEPNYCIRFNDSEHIRKSNITVGMLVYYCSDTEFGYTSLIFQQQLKMMKSHDAMGDNVESPVFSDDEKERAYYESLKQKNNKDSFEGAARKRQRTSSFTQNKPIFERQLSHPWNRSAHFRRCNQERQQALRNNGPSNLSQYESYPYNDPWMQYQCQSNMYWSSVPRNMHPMLTGQNAEYGPLFNESRLPQYGINYNPNSSGVTPNAQYSNMQHPQYPRIPFGASPRFSPAFPSFPMSYPQFPNASLSYSNMFYHIPARPPMHTNALCASLPPPPPPSTDSTTDN